ncbi:hypothetical protein BST61_g10560 [Cercospora zeina]
MNCASSAKQAYTQTQTAVAEQQQQQEEEECYVLATGTIRRKARPPQINTFDHRPMMQTSPSPRPRIAFNRGPSFLLNEPPQAHTSALEQENQQHPFDRQIPDIFKAEPSQSTDDPSTLPNAPSPLTPSPKTADFDLKYYKPGLHRENSGFDDETAQARHFARLVSRDECSPQRRRTPQKNETPRSDSQQILLQEAMLSPPPALNLSVGAAGPGAEDEGQEDDRRGRRRRRIGSEMDHEMTDA